MEGPARAPREGESLALSATASGEGPRRKKPGRSDKNNEMGVEMKPNQGAYPGGRYDSGALWRGSGRCQQRDSAGRGALADADSTQPDGGKLGLSRLAPRAGGGRLDPGAEWTQAGGRVDPGSRAGLQSTAADGGQAVLPEFNVLIAYDGFANRLYARQLMARLEETVGKLHQVVPHYLKFEQLLWPQVRRKAGQQAAQADLVIIAAYQEACLPCLAKRWLQERGRKNRLTYGPLVVLLRTSSREHSEPSSVQWHLHQVAHRTRGAIRGKQTRWTAREREASEEITWRCSGVWDDPKPIARSRS